MSARLSDHLPLIQDSVDQHQAMIAGLVASCGQSLQRLIDCCIHCLRQNGKLIFFGNGGSAADAQHFATELVVRFKKNNRSSLAAISLTSSGPLITACANDFSFEEIFSRQIEGVGNPGDVAIAISTSGNSPNVIKALERSLEMGLVATGLTGEEGGQMNGLADPLLKVPSLITARIQESHLLIGHILCEAIENERFAD